MYSDTPTGVGIYTREVWNRLIPKLQKENVAATAYAYNTPDLKNAECIKPVKIPLGLNAILKKSLSVHRLFWNFFCLPFLAKKYDLVYSFSTHGSPFIKNQIITIHDLICFSFPKQHRFQYLYFKYLLPPVLKRCKLIVVISEFTKLKVQEHYKIDPKKIIVVYNGGDHLKISNTLHALPAVATQFNLTSKPFFLTVGASYPHKNVERLITAMMALKTNASLVVVGAPNAYYQHLKNTVQNESISNILFLNYVSPQVLSWLYANCIANVYVSLYEGFGFPPFEAALHNTVSIISNTTALPEVYKDAALYVDPYDVASITNALQKVSEEGFDKTVYQQKFSSLIASYTWEKTAGAIEHLIENNLDAARL